MGTLGRAQAKKCHIYSAHYSSRADILKDGDVESRQRTSHGEMSDVESGATGKPFLSHRELIKVEPAEIIAFLRRIGRLPANDSA